MVAEEVPTPTSVTTIHPPVISHSWSSPAVEVEVVEAPQQPSEVTVQTVVN